MSAPPAILVFGMTGQVATALRRLGGVRSVGRDEADLSDPAACAALIAASGAAAVINAAAYTAVDRAEAEEARAQVINADAPGAMACTCAALGLPFVQISTDYVFDGSGTAPWPVDAPARPLGAYGRTKLAGEQAVRAAGGVHAILRSSWVFSAEGSNFVRTVLRLGAERAQLRVVADQIGGPTPAAAVAAACLRMSTALLAAPDKSGTYHFAGAPDTSWADFTREIFGRAGLACEVVDIPTAEYPTPARRPANSRLDCHLTERAFGLPRPDWRQGLAQVLAQLQR